MDRDAGIFNRVVLRFLKRHPALQGNRVVIVGESYGGTRATLMLQDVFNYASLSSASAPYRDTQLSDELIGYFSSVFATTTPNAVQIATKFGHQVLIEPVVVGDVQQRHFTVGTPDAFDPNQCLTPTCMKTSPGQPTTCDVYNCDKPVRWSDDLSDTASTNLTDVAILSTALGVNARTIEWMRASSRTKAYGRNDGSVIAPVNLVSTFGVLGAEDNYLVTLNNAVLDGYALASHWFTTGQGLILGKDYVNHLHNNVATLITVTKFDTVVFTPDIPYGLAFLRNDATFSSLVSGVGYSKVAITGLPRPGFDERELLSNHGLSARHHAAYARVWAQRLDARAE